MSSFSWASCDEREDCVLSSVQRAFPDVFTAFWKSSRSFASFWKVSVAFHSHGVSRRSGRSRSPFTRCGRSSQIADQRAGSRDPLEENLVPDPARSLLERTGGWTESFQGRAVHLSVREKPTEQIVTYQSSADRLQAVHSLRETASLKSSRPTALAATLPARTTGCLLGRPVLVHYRSRPGGRLLGCEFRRHQSVVAMLERGRGPFF